MSSSAGLSKVSSSSQRHLPVAFFELTSLPERTSERLRTRLVETAPVEELDNFRFGAPIVAERVDESVLPSFRRDNACQQQTYRRRR